jgi:hypothetical protein
LLAHVLLNYEVKFDPALGLKDGEVPPVVEFGNSCPPDANVAVMFRRREDMDGDGF